MTLLRKLIAYPIVGLVIGLCLPVVFIFGILDVVAAWLANFGDGINARLLRWSHSPAKRCAR